MATDHSAPHTGTPHNIPLGFLYGAGAGALWGLVFLAPEFVHDFTALQLAVGRYLVYGVLSSILIIPRWPDLKRHLHQRDWLALFWLSLFGNTLFFIFLSQAILLGGVALTALVIGFLPVAVTLIGSREKEALSLKALTPSLFFCLAGAISIGWQALTAPGSSQQSPLAIFYAVAALASWTIYTVGNSRRIKQLRGISLHNWNLLMGLATGAQAMALVPFAFMWGQIGHTTPQWETFVAVSATVAIIASFGGNALWYQMSRLLPLTMTGQMILFETLFALIYGFLWDWRLPHSSELAAFFFLVLSVLTCLSAHRPKNRHRHSPSTKQSAEI